MESIAIFVESGIETVTEGKITVDSGELAGFFVLLQLPNMKIMITK